MIGGIKGSMLIAIAMEAWLIGDCFKDPLGGGTRHETHSCTTYSNDDFKNSDATITINLPSPCPYILKQTGDSVHFAVPIVMPASESPSSPMVRLLDAHGYDHIGVYYGFVQPLPADGTTRALIAGVYAENFGSGLRDSLWAQFFYSPSLGTSKTAVAGAIFWGDTSSVFPTISGSGDLIVGQSGNYTLHPDWDTVLYKYRWAVNGTSISDSTATHPGVFTSAQLNTVTAYVSRNDGTEDTVQKLVDTRLGVSMDGPTLVHAPGGYCTGFYANRRGGFGMVTYQWKLGSLNDGTDGPSHTSYIHGVGNHILQITITDSTGAQAAITKTVTVSNTGGITCPE